MNAALKGAIDNAKAENVPNANIDRAIKKGSGELKGNQTVEVIYEAYGPGGSAIIIECLTDNKNRTINNVRPAIEKRGGRWAESGSVMYLFEKKGVVIGKGDLSDETELALIDAGAEDIDKNGDIISITTGMTSWNNARDVLKENGIEIEEAGLKYVPKQTSPISDVATAQSLMTFVETIEEDEDVSEVFTNADVSEEVAAQL